jgi:protease-4
MHFLKLLFSPITGLLGFIQKYFKSLLFLLVLFLIFSNTDPEHLRQPNLMKIELMGPIMESETVLERIKEAQKKHIKGVLFVVDSPGGAVAPSIEIAEALKRLKKEKPVIAYAAGTMASGSYYASIYADKIIANRGAMIGSIGVIMQGLNIAEVMEKVGVKEQTIAKGTYKQMGTMTRAWNPAEKAELDRLIEDTYMMFVSDVAKARGLDINNSKAFADAHVFIAKRAKDVGLIDTLGTLHDAEKLVEKESRVATPVWNSTSRVDKLLSRVVQESSTKIFSVFTGLKAY